MYMSYANAGTWHYHEKKNEERETAKGREKGQDKRNWIKKWTIGEDDGSGYKDL